MGGRYEQLTDERQREFTFLLALAGGTYPSDNLRVLLGETRQAYQELLDEVSGLVTLQTWSGDLEVLLMDPETTKAIQEVEANDPAHGARVIKLMGQVRLTLQTAALGLAVSDLVPQSEVLALVEACLPAVSNLARAALELGQFETVLDSVEVVLPVLREAGRAQDWIDLAKLGLAAATGLEARAPAHMARASLTRKARAMFNLAYGYQAAGDLANAVDTLELAVETAGLAGMSMDPTDVLALADMVGNGLGDPARGLGILERHRDLLDQDSVVWLALHGQLLVEAGDRLEGLRSLGEALAKALRADDVTFVSTLDRLVATFKAVAEAGGWRELGFGATAILGDVLGDLATGDLPDRSRVDLARLVVSWAGMVGFIGGDRSDPAMQEALAVAGKIDSMNQARWGLEAWLRRAGEPARG